MLKEQKQTSSHHNTHCENLITIKELHVLNILILLFSWISEVYQHSQLSFKNTVLVDTVYECQCRLVAHCCVITNHWVPLHEIISWNC